MTIQKNINSSPRKLRLVAEMIRKMKPEEAIEVLQFTNKAAARPLANAIKTVLANGGNQATLSFEKIEINEGPKLKRVRATGGRGRGRPYKRRWSHIKIVLTDEVVEKIKSQKEVKRGERIPKGDPSVAKLPQDDKQIEKL